ncbi:MAG: hypothetical protein ABI120_24000, partial [Gemmatimonadaceae bacterium]
MRLLVRYLAALFVLGAPAQSALAQITVDRESVTLNPARTDTRAVNLAVRNGGAAAVQLSLQLEDWEVDAQGASHWRTAGVVAGSCGHRVFLWPKTLQLAPGEQQFVRVSVSANAHFEAECWSAAVVRATNVASGQSRSDTSATMRTTV